MNVIKFFDNNNSSELERNIFYSFVAHISDVSTDSLSLSRHFILFIVCDFSVYSIDELSEFAEKMIDKGVAYVCTWGKDSEKMHDIFDEIAVYREVIENQGDFPIMTTWHSEDTLDEALWFALFSAFPDEKYAHECKSTLIITVKDEQFDKDLRLRLSDIEKFNKKLLEEKNNEQLTTNNEQFYASRTF